MILRIRSVLFVREGEELGRKSGVEVRALVSVGRVGFERICEYVDR